MLFRTAPVLAAVVLTAGPSDAAASPQPFAKLFPVPSIGSQSTPRAPRVPSPRLPQAPQSSRSAQPVMPGQPRIACGTKIEPVDPAYDARIRKQAPTRPKPSARIVPTPPCD